MRWDEWRGSLDGRPTMWIRYFIRHRLLHVALHKFVRADDPECFHTHPATAIRFILVGGYIEEFFDGRIVEWKPWRVGIIRPTDCHRIAYLRESVSYSIWIRFRRTATVQLIGAGWKQKGSWCHKLLSPMRG